MHWKKERYSLQNSKAQAADLTPFDFAFALPYVLYHWAVEETTQRPAKANEHATKYSRGLSKGRRTVSAQNSNCKATPVVYIQALI